MEEAEGTTTMETQEAARLLARCLLNSSNIASSYALPVCLYYAS